MKRDAAVTRRLFARWEPLVPDGEDDAPALHPDKAELEMLAKERRRFRVIQVVRGISLVAFLTLTVSMLTSASFMGRSWLTTLTFFSLYFIGDLVTTIRMLEPKVLRQRLFEHRVRSDLLAGGLEAARATDARSCEKAPAPRNADSQLGQLPSR